MIRMRKLVKILKDIPTLPLKHYIIINPMQNAERGYFLPENM